MCKHLFELSRADALLSNGRYYDQETKGIVCFSCETAPYPTDGEVKEMREEAARRVEEDELLRQEEEKSRVEWLKN